MTVSPRVVLGMPAYKRPDTLARTIESILGQTCRDFALIIVDDGPTEAIGSIVDRYLRLDPRISYERNPRRLGMVKNWRKCFRRAREAYPQSAYFAWVSDHDFWHPRWLELLVAELDANPGVSLAYPRTLRIHRTVSAFVPRSFETFGIKDPVERVRLAAERIFAGDLIYGLFRVSTLAAAGVLRLVLLPDRQVLVALAALGEFRQVDEVLWYREVPHVLGARRQRAALFAGAVSPHVYLPYYVQHCGLMLWDFGVRGRGGTLLDRATGLRAAVAQLLSSIKRDRQPRKARAAESTSPDEAFGEIDA